MAFTTGAVVVGTVRRGCGISRVGARGLASNTASFLDSARLKYKTSPQSFYNLPLDKIDFAVGLSFKANEPTPQLVFDKKVRASGLLHSTPFANVVFPKFSDKGTYGTKFDFGKDKKGEITDPADAELQINVSVSGFEGEDVNEDMLQYAKWLQGIKEKYARHLTDNLKEYPNLKKRFGFLEKSGTATVVEALLQSSSELFKPMKDKLTKEELPNRQFVSFKQKLFWKTTDEAKKPQTYCDFDVESLNKGLYRNHVPLYDCHGKEVPVPEAVLHHGDIAAVQAYLVPNLWEIGSNVGWGIRFRMRSVTLLATNPRTSESNEATAPFGDILTKS